MMVRSELVAVLTVYNKRHGGRFDEEDQRLLAIIAAQSAQVVENARLFEREKELLHMKHEVELAARIQRNLLPRRSPEIPGYDIAGLSIAAQEVGGDYFDFIPLPEGLLGICLGDVSGKGLPASLLMSNVQAILRTHSSFGNSPAAALAGANRLLFDCTDTDKYVTLFYGALDPSTGILRYANAGHDRPLLFDRDGASHRLEKRSVMLGMTGDFTFAEESVEIDEGEILVVVSDGITEASGRVGEAEEEEEFGEEKLVEVVRQARSLGAGEIAAAILDAVRMHATGMPQDDDMTVVVIKHQRQNA
jgi:sigma-B regulation protein RsbU (phosphoserine phosphatase)